MAMMPQVTPPAGKPGSWTVGTMVERYGSNAQGQLVKGYEVHFQTGSGIASSVWVPEASLSPQVVAGLIRNKVAQLDAVNGLSTPGKPS